MPSYSSIKQYLQLPGLPALASALASAGKSRHVGLLHALK